MRFSEQIETCERTLASEDEAMAAAIMSRPREKVDGFCIRFLGWAICKIEVGDNHLRDAHPIALGFQTEAEAEKVFRAEYAEKHPRGIHGSDGQPHVMRNRDIERNDFCAE